MEKSESSFFFFFFFEFYFIYFFFKFYFIFKLYITVLDLPNIKMNPPQVLTLLVGMQHSTGTMEKSVEIP